MQVKETLCWSCRRATNIDGVCSWSKELKPLKDWEAEERIMNDVGMKHGNITYLVVKCPLFLPDLPKKKPQLLLMYREIDRNI